MREFVKLAAAVFAGEILARMVDAGVRTYVDYREEQEAAEFRDDARKWFATKADLLEKIDLDSIGAAVAFRADHIASVLGGARRDHFEDACQYVEAQIRHGLEYAEIVKDMTAPGGSEDAGYL